MRTKNKIFEISNLIDEINLNADSQMKGIDWEKNVADITRTVKLNKFKKINSRTFNFSFRLAIPVVAVIFIMGISIGYFFSSKSIIGIEHLSPQKTAKITLARLESTLNKREINIYFEQAHLLITEIMEVCKDKTIKTDTKYLNNRRVKKLLKKNRYFKNETSDSQWLVSRNLLQKVEWVLLEILMSDGELGCEKQKKLQKYISEERLLFKLRLLSSEASFSEV